MRAWLLMFVLLLSILIHEVYGIRLRKGIPPHRQHGINIHEVTQGKIKNNIDGVEGVIVCKSKNCSGRIRKLTVSPTSSTTTIAKNDKNEENKLEGSSSSNDPDILDLAEMDYSLAKRKPPIHN